MAKLYCDECGGEFDFAKALYWHLRRDEEFSHEAAFDAVGAEMDASASRPAKGESLESIGRKAGWKDADEETSRKYVYQLKGGQYLR
jgi:hypothetical protein